MNWKGENFYTGNHVAIFISSGGPMKAYLDERRDRGERTVYFVTERGRVATLRNELGAVRSFTELTGPDVSHEFTLQTPQGEPDTTVLTAAYALTDTFQPVTDDGGGNVIPLPAGVWLGLVALAGTGAATKFRRKLRLG